MTSLAPVDSNKSSPSFFAKIGQTAKKTYNFVAEKVKKHQSILKKIAMVAFAILCVFVPPMGICAAAGFVVGLIFPKQVQYTIDKIKSAWKSQGIFGKIAMGIAGGVCMLTNPFVPGLVVGAYFGKDLRSIGQPDQPSNTAPIKA